MLQLSKNKTRRWWRGRCRAVKKLRFNTPPSRGRRGEKTPCRRLGGFFKTIVLRVGKILKHDVWETNTVQSHLEEPFTCEFVWWSGHRKKWSGSTQNDSRITGVQQSRNCILTFNNTYATGKIAATVLHIPFLPGVSPSSPAAKQYFTKVLLASVDEGGEIHQRLLAMVNGTTVSWVSVSLNTSCWWWLEWVGFLGRRQQWI